MPRFRLTGNYGTFVISKVIHADDEDEAIGETGIMAALEEDGWTFDEGPDNEIWEVTNLDDEGPLDDDWIQAAAERAAFAGRPQTTSEMMLDDLLLDGPPY